MFSGRTIYILAPLHIGEREQCANLLWPDLDRVIELVTTQTFKERRRELYDFQIGLLQQRYKPEQILSELNQHVRDFNAQALAHGRKCRWETVITVQGPTALNVR